MMSNPTGYALHDAGVKDTQNMSDHELEDLRISNELDIAIAAYNEVWQNSGSIDSSNVDEIRKNAMMAAYKAIYIKE